MIVALLFVLSGCKEKPATTPDYQVAIDAKYKSLGWTQGADNGGVPQQTDGKKGWVQYYGSKDRAIYYYPADGSYAGGTFGVLKEVMTKYNSLGMELYIGLGRLTSGETTVNGLFHFADTEFGIVTNGDRVVYGEIYKKYKALNRWEGKLGFPLNDESDLSSKKGRYNAFTGGQIYWSASTGAQAFWGLTGRMYGATGYDTGWLGLPTTSCDPAKDEILQVVKFEKGTIRAFATCGSYQNLADVTVTKEGKTASNIPCYNP